MKRAIWITVVLAIIGMLALTWLWLCGWTRRSTTVANMTRLQYFKEPALLAVHVNSPSGVFVIPSIPDEYATEIRGLVDPARIEMEYIDLSASSIHDKWSDTLERRDSLQFGVHGSPRGTTRPNYFDKVALGTSQDRYPYQTFQWMSEEEFAKQPLGVPVTDVKIYGRMTFSRYYHIGFRKKPFIIP